MDVVVPFAGSDTALRATLTRLEGLSRQDGDTVVVADNRPGARARASDGDVRIVAAGDRRGSYFARNRGAEAGDNPWLVFVDADVEPPADLLDRYFAEAPGERCGVLGGSVVDEPPDGAATPAVRYAHTFGLMSQDVTLARPRFAYFQTANCAVRREAFDAVGGFREEIRSGGDADLCFRIRDAGWALERRDGARVVHRSRTTVRALLRQRVRVGAGARWLEERYPGFAPRRPLWRVLAGDARRLASGLAAMARGGGDDALVRTFDALQDAAFQVGWRLPNHADGSRRR